MANGLRDATRSGKPYPVKAWIVYATNLIQSLPNPAETIEAIRKLDFMVAVDTMPAEITGWADVVLPECTYLERYDDLLNPPFRQPFVSLRQPVVPPMYDSKPGWWIARELGLRMGLEKYFPWKDAEQYLNARLARTDLSLAELRQKGVITKPSGPIHIAEGAPVKFDTPSGKIELASDALRKAGFDAVPKFTPQPQPPAGYFRLLYGRSPVHTFGRTTNNRMLTELQPENELWLNADMAKDLDVKDGEYVRLTNQDSVNSGRIKAKVTERIRPDCVYMVHGFGHSSRRLRAAHGKGADDNGLITRYSVDPIMGGTGMRGNFVRIEKSDC